MVNVLICRVSRPSAVESIGNDDGRIGVRRILMPMLMQELKMKLVHCVRAQDRRLVGLERMLEIALGIRARQKSETARAIVQRGVVGDRIAEGQRVVCSKLVVDARADARSSLRR